MTLQQEQQLERILRAEVSALSGARRAALELKSALLDENADAVDSCMPAMSYAAEQVEQAEAERLDWLEHVRPGLGDALKSASVDELVSAGVFSAECRVPALVAELKAAVGELWQLQDENSNMLRQSLQFVNFMLHVLSDDQAGYNARGKTVKNSGALLNKGL